MVLVKKSITGGARRDPFAAKFLLRGNAKIFRGCTGGDDQCIAGVLSGIAGQYERPVFEINVANMIGDDFGVKTLSVFLHALHERRPLQALDIARPVVHIGGGH